MRRLTWAQVWQRRLERHHLVGSAPSARLADVVGDVCGVHAQVMTAAELSIGARVAGITREHVQAELWERRTLIKTYGLRGTLHLLPADELPMWVAALRASPTQPGANVLELLGIEQAQMDAMVGAIGDALDGSRLTRRELGDEVVRRVGSWANEEVFPAFGGMHPRWMPAIGAAATAGLLCFGPNRGNRVTFVRPDQWSGGWNEVDGSQALAEVMRRYLAAYGPATHRGFAHWFHMKPEDARRLMRSMDDLEEVDVEGDRAWLLAADVEAPWASGTDTLRLLPDYDCYVIGCGPVGRERQRLVPLVAGARVFDRGAGPSAVMLVDGVVAGVWKRRSAGAWVQVHVEPFVRLTSPQRRRLDAEAARIAGFLGAEVELSVGPSVRSRT